MKIEDWDEKLMRRAIALGEKGRISAPPNPWVGCVIAKMGKIIGEGYHVAAGEPHAEINALNALQGEPTGATVYTTLEPCSHHGRTPPCVDALIAAKVWRVVIALEDPDPRVSGKGIAALRKAGITVKIGVCAKEATYSLDPYLHHRKTGLPFCLAKIAASVDGRTAAADGTSQWITTSGARADTHRLRAESQAIMIGSGTALADTPSLTVRLYKTERQKQPLRVLLDASGKVPAEAPLFDTEEAPLHIYTTSHCPQDAISAWEKAGATVEVVPPSETGRGVDLRSVMRSLGAKGILQVLVEGGATLHGSLLNAGLINRYVVYSGPLLLGDRGLPMFSGFSPETMRESQQLHLDSVTKIGDCIRAEYSFATARAAQR